MYCRECGKPLLESDKFCSNCGTPVRKITPADEPMFRTEEMDRPVRKTTAPLPSFNTEEPAPEKREHGERLIFEAIGNDIQWDTDVFPDKTPKKTKDMDFNWNVGDDEFRNRPGKILDTKLSVGQQEPSLWSDGEMAASKPKSTGLKPSDTNSWDELFEGTRQDDKNTRKASPVGRNSIEAYWEDMFRRDGADKKEKEEKEPVQHASRRFSISRDDIERGIGEERSERLDQNKLEDTMTLSREEMEGALRGEEPEPQEKPEKKETRENREVAELASLAAAGIGAGPTFVPEGTVAVTLPEDKEPAPTENERVITGQELEQELFREMEEPMTEAQKMRARQTEKIDKFYTFNKKNEEFQKLLDQEYERFKKSRQQEEIDDLGADLYKLGDENFFEDFSNEGASQALEMARARQSTFHSDEFDELVKAANAAPKEELPAEEAPVIAEVPEEAAPAESPAQPADMPAEEPADMYEEPAEEIAAGSRREKKQKKSFFGRLFGKDTAPIDRDELAAAVAAAGLAETAAEPAEAPEEEPAAAPAMPHEEEPEAAAPEAEAEEPAAPAATVTEEASAAEEEAPAEKPEEEPITASIVFEPEEEEPAQAPAAEEAPAEEPADEQPAAEEPEEAPVEEEPAEEEPEEEAEPVTASIVYDPETDTQETIVEPAHADEPAPAEEPEEPADEVPRTTEPTRIYEKGDIPTPTTEEERASAFEENRAAAWDAFFSDDEEVNAGNTFDAEEDDYPDDEKEGGASIAASVLAVILVMLLALIVVRLVLPDSIISVKLDQFVEMILNLFHGNAVGTLINYIM